MRPAVVRGKDRHAESEPGLCVGRMTWARAREARRVASPTLEMFVSEMSVTLHERQAPATTLELFDLDL